MRNEKLTVTSKRLCELTTGTYFIQYPRITIPPYQSPSPRPSTPRYAGPWYRPPADGTCRRCSCVQPASLQIRVLAPVAAMQLALSSTIAPLMAGYLIAKVPPKPQHWSVFSMRLEVDVPDLLEQPHAFVLHADAAQVAGVVIGDRSRVSGSLSCDRSTFSTLSRNSTNSYVRATSLFMPCSQAGSPWSRCVELLADHGAAAAAGGDDVVVRLEDLDHPLGQLAGFVVKAVVEERLAAAGLRLREMRPCSRNARGFW